MFVSNAVGLLASAVVVLLLPRAIGAEPYGYFQLFLFYATFVGFLHLGWCDGVYLRYGGEDFAELPRPLIGRQFRFLFATQVILSLAMLGLTLAAAPGPDQFFVLVAVAVAGLMLNARVFLVYLLQATNRIREYAKVTILDRGVYLLGVAALLALRVEDFRGYVLCSLMGSTASLAAAAWYCRPALSGAGSWLPNDDDRVELGRNVSVGIGLMLANVASLLVIGVIRFTIERVWGVAEFGRISLLLNLLGLVLIFVNAVGIVLFPILRRVDSTRWAYWFAHMRTVLMAGLLPLLLLYAPVLWAIGLWLPAYAGTLAYLPILFPVFIFESKQSLVSNTFFKSLRLERAMLVVNVLAVVVSLGLSLATALAFGRFDWTVAVILVAVLFRSMLSDLILARHMGLRLSRELVAEALVVAAFVAASALVGSGWSTLVVMGCLAVYALVRGRSVIDAVRAFAGDVADRPGLESTGELAA